MVMIIGRGYWFIWLYMAVYYAYVRPEDGLSYSGTFYMDMTVGQAISISCSIIVVLWLCIMRIWNPGNLLGETNN